MATPQPNVSSETQPDHNEIASKPPQLKVVGGKRCKADTTYTPDEAARQVWALCLRHKNHKAGRRRVLKPAEVARFEGEWAEIALGAQDDGKAGVERVLDVIHTTDVDECRRYRAVLDVHCPDELMPAQPHEATDDPHRLARVYLDANHRHPDHTTLVYHNGEFHEWDTAYRPVPIQAMRASLTSSTKAEFNRANIIAIELWEKAKVKANGEDQSNPRGKAKGEDKKKPAALKVTTALTNNVVQALGGETLLGDKHAAPCWLGGPGRWPAAEVLPTQNALLHLPSFAARIEPYRVPPTPRFFCPYATDYDLDESAPAPAEWLKFLARLWPDDQDSIDALQEWFGYHLTPDTSQEKIGMLIGPKRSGKGTIAKVLTAMIGEANVCNPKFGALGSQFGTESLIGKMAAIITDARITSRTDIAQVVENLLTISGTDRQTIARKHKTDWSGNLPTKFTIISNELPRLADASGALPGRMIIFQLTHSFYGQEDTKLFSQKILPEMPGILLWAVEGWKRLRDQGRLRQPKAGEQLVEEMEELSSPIGVFLRDCCTIKLGESVATDVLFDAWEEWCQKVHRDAKIDHMTFGRNLRSVIPNLETKKHRRGTGFERRYHGLKLGISAPSEVEDEAPEGLPF